MYPDCVRIQEDFFEDPHALRRLAVSASYSTPPSQLDPLGRGPIAEFTPCDEATRALTLAKLVPMIGDIGEAQIEFRYIHARTIKRQWCHADGTDMAGIVHLTLPEHGTGSTVFFRHRPTGDRWARPENRQRYHFDDPAEWEETHRVEMAFNRIVIYPGALFHAVGTPYFGETVENSRLTQNLFINLRDSLSLRQQLEQFR